MRTFEMIIVRNESPCFKAFLGVSITTQNFICVQPRFIRMRQVEFFRRLDWIARRTLTRYHILEKKC